MLEKQVLGEAALLFGNGRKTLDLFRVNDGEVEAGLGAVIQEDRVNHFASAGGQPEGNVRNSENGAGVGKRLLNQANAFQGFDRTANIIFVAGGAREDQRIENDVLGRDSIFFREQFVGTLGDGKFTFASEGLGLHRVFIDAADDERGAKIAGDGHDLLEFFFAVFEVDGIDDGFALAIGEGLADGDGIGGVDHDRRLDFADQLFVERRNVFFLVALGALQADVDDVRAAFDLAAGDFRGLLPLFLGHQIFEQARADHIGTLTHEQWACAVLGFDGLDTGIDGAMSFGRADARLFALDHLRERTNVLFGSAAAATDDVEPTVTDEFLELRR